MKKLTLLMMGLWLSHALPAQNVEGFFQQIRDRAKDNPLVIHGGLSTAFTYAHITGLDRRRDPYTWNLNANLGLDIMGIKAPFSLNMSDGDLTYNLPAYRFVGISPSYKWIKLHFGDRSMNFSPFTLSGQSFTGAGMELTPGKFRIAAMYGRLRRANANDFTANQNIDPVFRRMAWGTKIGYGTSNDFIDLVLFSANDKAESIDTTFWNNARPAENFIIGLNGRKQITEQLSLFAEYAGSAYNPDQSLNALNKGSRTAWNSGFGMIDATSSSYFANAINAGAALQLDKAQLSLAYKRVGANYRSLGTFYLYNDFENYTLQVAFPLWQGRLNVSMNGGLERNNLSNTQASENTRTIGAINVDAHVTPSSNLSFSYSNFYNTNKIRQFIDPTNPVDSLFIAQVNQNASVAYNTIFNPETKNALTLMFSYQNTTTVQGEEIQTDDRSHFYNANASYIHPLPKWKMNVTTSLNLNRITSVALESWTLGPSVSVSRLWLEDKLSTRLTLANSTVLNEGSGNSNILNLRGGIQYQVFKNHNLGLDYSLINRESSSMAPFTEQIGSVRYGYNF